MGIPNPWADAPAPRPAAAPAPATPSVPASLESELPTAPQEEVNGHDLSQPVTEEEAEEGGFGVFLKQQTSGTTPAESAPEPVSAPTSIAPVAKAVSLSALVEREPTLQEEKRPQSNSPAPTAAPAPMSASTLQKMKDQGMYRNQYFKDADCFECSHKFKVSRSSKSANCPNCGAFISLEDIEINMPSTQSIKTRGDVLIRKRGQVSAESIHCKDLRCYGVVEANVSVSGDAIFRTTGTMIGKIHCRRFIIEKGCDVVFLNEVRAEEVDVQARVTGSIFSSGPLVIGANGSVNGDVTARSVSIEPGGELNGAMNIVRSQPAPKPVVVEDAP